MKVHSVISPRQRRAHARTGRRVHGQLACKVCHPHPHAKRPPRALNSDFNEQVPGRETKGTEQLISPDCSQSCASEFGWRGVG